MSRLAKGYLIFAAIVLAGWAAVAFTGREFFNAPEQRLPAEARAPGGPRTFHFWHSGYRGGK